MKLALVWLTSWVLSGVFMMFVHNLWTDHDDPECQVVSSRIQVPLRPVPEVVVVYAPYKKGKIDMMPDPSEAWVYCTAEDCID